MHKIEKIDNERFNFMSNSNLSIDPEQNEAQFKIVLWQLACSLTTDTIIDPLVLPFLSEAEFQKNDKFVEEYNDRKVKVEAYLEILTGLINDDYSFFFNNRYYI